MTQAAIANGSVDAGGALAAADNRLAQAGVVLEQLVTLGPSALIDDETVARVRALAGDLAGQLVSGQLVSGQLMAGDLALADTVRDLLVANRAIVLHLHALAIETRLITALAARRVIDPVLPPLVRRRLDAGAVGEDAAAETTALLSAQTRLGQALRRMRLPLEELPGDLHHLALAIADAARADRGIADQPVRAEPRDDKHSRLALLHRVLAGLGDDMALALRIDDAGVPLFLSALALASRQPREMVTLACAEDDPIRLALLLRAAGLTGAQAAAQLLAIRPDADPALTALPADAQAAETWLGGVADA